MEIKGTVIKVLPSELIGQNQAKKQTFIIETEGQYPKKVAIDIWKDTISVTQGESATFHLNAESREASNGRWFTGLSAWKKEGGQQAGATLSQPVVSGPPPAKGMEEDLDIPF